MSEKMGDAVGGFELERKLGVGSLATAWLAHPVGKKSHARTVVLKVLNEQLSENREMRALFEEEAQAAQGLDHPNVAKVVATGRDGARCYVAMEQIDGVDLRSAMAAHEGPLWPALAVALIADACKGLAYAHRRGVIHRDISSGNLMVDVDGRVKLLDFGIARARSPELKDQVATPATDVYALAVALHELVKKPNLPRPLLDTLQKATAPELKKRFATAVEFEAALRTFLQKWAPPLPKEIGEQVEVWKKKLASGPPRPRKLESFEPLKLERESGRVTAPLPPRLPPKAAPKLEEKSAGQSDWEVDTDPQREPPPLPSVVLDPELEKLAERHHGPKKQKKPRGKK